MLSRLIVQSQPMISMSLTGRPSFIRNQIARQFHRRDTMTRAQRIEQNYTSRQRQTLKEKVMTPAGPNAFAIGKGALLGGSALGLGALCFYGLGITNNSTNILNNSMAWPEYVRERIHDTYAYFGGSIAITAASAAAIFRTPALMNIFAQGSWISLIATIGLMMGSGMIARAIPYEEGFGIKQISWITHCSVMGAALAPLSFIGGGILLRALWYTAGVVGGLSVCAVCAPNDRFLFMGGPLAIGLGVVFASSLGSIFLSPSTALGAGLYSMSLYGGLLLFSAFLLYDTQRIIHKAETHPNSNYAVQKFDPINAAISIYMDTLNIFIRLVSILAGQGGSRR
ncbi:growth hormone-inducible transmembrane protein-like [Contarinia nasturtii]|uniref:growth hormone-inducible transmembrane protein-like n=1 Tax=Contarinia nasturtii TaxID=265458 RepID=UPI0012D3D96C|nr:growth hormone-inducible transmembrane protein-like [Contarinia nasturtii]